MKHEYIECACGSSEHFVRIMNEPELTYPHLYVSLQLHPFYGFWKRVLLAFRYIFGLSNRFGFWTDAMLTGDEVLKLKNICESHLSAWEKYNKKEEEK